MEPSTLHYLTEVLGIKYIPEVENSDKITLAAYLDLKDEIQVKGFEKIKNLLNEYDVLGSVFVNEDVKSSGLVLYLGRLGSTDVGNGIWKRVGDQMIMWTHSVSEFGNKNVKATVWRDIKRAIRMCGVEV